MNIIWRWCFVFVAVTCALGGRIDDDPDDALPAKSLTPTGYDLKVPDPFHRPEVADPPDPLPEVKDPSPIAEVKDPCPIVDYEREVARRVNADMKVVLTAASDEVAKAREEDRKACACAMARVQAEAQKKIDLSQAESKQVKCDADKRVKDVECQAKAIITTAEEVSKKAQLEASQAKAYACKTVQEVVMRAKQEVQDVHRVADSAAEQKADVKVAQAQASMNRQAQIKDLAQAAMVLRLSSEKGAGPDVVSWPAQEEQPGTAPSSPGAMSSHSALDLDS